MAEKKQERTLRIKLVKSVIGANPKQRATVSGLGFKRTNQELMRVDTPEIRGMVAKVCHLVHVVEGKK